MLDKRLLREASKVRFLLTITVGFGFITGVLAILQASTLSKIVARVFLNSQTLPEVWSLMLLLLTFIFLRAIFVWSSEVTAHRAAAQIKASLRSQLLEHLFALGPLYIKGERTGELVNLLVEGVESVEDYFARYLPQLALAALTPLTVLAFVFPFDFITGLILLFTAPLIPIFMILIGKWADSLTKRQWESLSRMSAHFLDVLQGLATLKLFGRSREQIAVIARISNNFGETTLGVLKVAFLSALMLELLSTLSTALVAVALGLRLVYDRIPFEQAFFLLLLAPEFYLPLRLLGTQFHAGMSGTSAAQRIFEVLDIPIPVKEKELTSIPSGDKLHIAFQHVTFTYPGGESPALREISFELKPGEKVAVVGPSGAGKSTITNLLSRFGDPDKGSILVNEIPLDQLPVDLWRSKVSLISQNPYLFYGTVAENLLQGNSNASQEDMVNAAKMAGAHEFIESFPEGYQTQVGEWGIRLSGGQAQRIAIARAFLKNAPILVMDEASAGLDPVNEEAIQKVMYELMEGKTVLIIAHRLSTVRSVDRILVLDQGQLVEEGTHQELLEGQGLYLRLVSAYRGVA